MYDIVRRQPRRSSVVDSDRILQHRLTRRSLLRGATSLGAAALVAGAASPAFAGPGQWTPLTTADQYGADVANEWFRLMVQIWPTTPGLSPAPGERAFAYLGVALYESLIGGMPGRKSLAGRLNELDPVPGQANRAYHWPSVANSALATSMRELFRMTPEENLAAIDGLESSLASAMEPGIPFGIAKRSARRGQQVADHIMAWAATDGGHDGHLTNFPPDYVPPIGEGLWVSTPPAFLGAYQPYWGTNRSMVLETADDVDPGPPPFSTDPTSEFYLGELEVYETVNMLTDEQRAIARHWANPIGHHVLIAVQAVEAQNTNLAAAAAAYARSGIAICDSTIACFHTKYRYNLVRPVTFIQAHINADWTSFIPSPPHPDYTAAHSVVTGAFAQALYDQFGDFSFTDHTWDGVPLPARSYNSWSEMAEETAISRLYAGIHSRWAIEAGLEQGRRVGEMVSAVFN